MNKASNRDKKGMYKENANLPTYKPNFLYGKKELSVSIPDFTKMKPRNNLIKPADPT